MKALRGTATSVVAAPIEQCLALVEAVDGYPRWYPEVVREVEVTEAADDGRPTRARAMLHVSRGPLVKDFRLLLAIDVERPTIVRLTRIASGPSDQQRFNVTWRLEDHGDTRIRLELDANLSVPRFLPLGGIGDAMAEGFVQAAIGELDPPHG
jgi:ribosome-associated toxin RatA of RatAB toxin-antitoxin module